MEKEYQICNIRNAANQIYGKEISPSAWRKWLRLFDVPRWSRTLTAQQSLFILTYAHLRKQNKIVEIGKKKVIEEIKKIPKSPEKLYECVDETLFQYARGRDLPCVIRQVTGRQVSLRTVYRWAEAHKLKFGANTVIDSKDVQRLIDIAS